MLSGKQGSLWELNFMRPIAVLSSETDSLSDVREDAIIHGADYLIVLSSYHPVKKRREIMYREDLSSEKMFQSKEKVSLGILKETNKGSYGYIFPYHQVHPLELLNNQRFYKMVMDSEAKGFEPKRKYIDQFKKTGRFYTGTLDDHPTFDYLFIGNKNGTSLLVARDGSEVLISY